MTWPSNNVDYGTLFSGVAALLTVGLGVYVQVIRRSHRRSITENRARIVANEQEVAIAVRTAELQLQVWKELSNQLRGEVRDFRDREKAMRVEISSYRTEVIGLKNWIRAHGLPLPDDL